jgi:wyosine [tRNA(Phe)-imidazoG37] synthetase (radical SAM superfamily)
MITFGPVPSRRLGRSLGINNIPPKVCSYSCVYCQVGRTLNIQVERRTFYEPEKILEEALDRVKKAEGIGEAIDYLTFVPDGEPTLDENLGRTIELLKPLGIRIAVITNGSLIWREDVREELMKADWVSLKVDSTIEKIWRKTNRPHRSLQLDSILNGMLEFKRTYHGELVTETMLAKGVNDGDANLKAVAGFLARLKPARAYLSIPTRPPAEKRVHSPNEEVVNKAYQILSKQVDQVEYLIGYEGDAFAFTGNAEEDLLSITAVHPMREEAVKEFVFKAGAIWSVVRGLVDQGRLIESEYEGQKFYMRRFPKRKAG